MFSELEQGQRKEFDEEVEKISKMDSDKTTEVLESKQFRKVSEEAFKSVRKRKREIPAMADVNLWQVLAVGH